MWTLKPKCVWAQAFQTRDISDSLGLKNLFLKPFTNMHPTASSQLPRTWVTLRGGSMPSSDVCGHLSTCGEHGLYINSHRHAHKYFYLKIKQGTVKRRQEPGHQWSPQPSWSWDLPGDTQSVTFHRLRIQWLHVTLATNHNLLCFFWQLLVWLGYKEYQ